MSLDRWILALHLLSAASLGAAIVLFWVGIVAVRRTDIPETTTDVSRIFPVGSVAVIAGSLGTVVFGVWLAISLDAYQVWDGWVIAALVLWAIASETGRRADKEYAKGVERAKELLPSAPQQPDAELGRLNRTGQGVMLHTIASAAVVLILIDMIWKPGA
jgi:uncharacterized membrane protein